MNLHNYMAFNMKPEEKTNDDNANRNRNRNMNRNRNNRNKYNNRNHNNNRNQNSADDKNDEIGNLHKKLVEMVLIKNN